jgi:ABC-type sugar transport system permease subunit
MDMVNRGRRERGVSLSRWRSSTSLYGYGTIAPAVIVIALFTIYPFFYAISASMRHLVLTMPYDQRFIGLGNFIEVVKSYYFFTSLKNTLVYMLSTLILVVIFGMMIALYLNSRFPGSNLVMIIILIPWAVPTVVAGIIWKLMFHGSYGALNGALYSLGIIDEYIAWLSNKYLAKAAVIIAHVWKETPLVAILFLAGLQTIPKELHEAAMIDGSSAFKSFFRITVPFLKPIILVVCVYESMVGLATFDLLYVMTGGGPGDATSLIGWFAYTETFSFLNIGHGAAVSLILALILLAFIMLYLRLIRIEEMY